MNKNKLDSLILLRGIAVTAVCFCHVCGAISSDNAFSKIFKFFDDYGKYGVQVFFVISGFIIPLSLFKANYSINNYRAFLWKRVVRLHPPYLAALALTLIIAYLSYKIRHIIYPENLTTILKSIFYFHIPADNPVFWTLAVEAQYYVFIGLAYLILEKAPTFGVLVFVPFLVLLGQTSIVDYVSLFCYINFFLIGTVGYLIFTKQANPTINWLTLCGLLIHTFYVHELAAAIAALFSLGFILLYKKSIPKSLHIPGEISYSMYLLHFPIGVKFINLFLPHFSRTYQPLLFIIDLALISIVSWFFWKYIETPFANFSSNIKFKKPITNKETILQT